MPASDDLAALLAQKPKATMRYGQGKIIEWDPTTFANVIEWNGQRLHDLPVVGTTDALSYQPGQYVALHSADESGKQAATQWWIAGRILIPGSDNAEAIVAFLRGSLAREISAEIFADRIDSKFDAAIAERTTESWGDPTNGADPGPILPDVDIKTGTAIIIASCNVRASTEDTTAVNTSEYAGLIGVDIAGATTMNPDLHRVINNQMLKYNNSGITTTDGISSAATATIVFPVTGLNAGLHTFTMQYRKPTSATTACQVDDRSLTVLAF